MEQTAVEWFANELYQKFEMKGDGNLFVEILEQGIEIEKRKTRPIKYRNLQKTRPKMKNKETLEEAAEKYANQFIDGRDDYYGFIEGAKWQQEKDNKLYIELVDLLERLTIIYKQIRQWK